MHVLLLSVSDQHANTEKSPSQLKHRVHQNSKIRKISLSLKYTGGCFWVIFLNFLASGMTNALPWLVHMETVRFCLDMLLEIADFVVAMYLYACNARLFIASGDNEICSLL
jgi:hypothetical protein